MCLIFQHKLCQNNLRVMQFILEFRVWWFSFLFFCDIGAQLSYLLKLVCLLKRIVASKNSSPSLYPCKILVWKGSFSGLHVLWSCGTLFSLFCYTLKNKNKPQKKQTCRNNPTNSNQQKKVHKFESCIRLEICQAMRASLLWLLSLNGALIFPYSMFGYLFLLMYTKLWIHIILSLLWMFGNMRSFNFLTLWNTVSYTAQ